MKTAASILLSLGLTLCAAQNVPLPVIPAATFKITDFGATGNGKTPDTPAIQKRLAQRRAQAAKTSDAARAGVLSFTRTGQTIRHGSSTRKVILAITEI
jgi:hypothetical protein